VIRVPLGLVAQALPGAKLRGRAGQLVWRLNADSRRARPGDLFACIAGKRVDGHLFAAEAVRRGATAVLLSREIPGLDLRRIGVIQTEQVARALGAMAASFYNHPSLGLRLLGVTGTSGKTTVTYMLRSILQASPAALGLRRVGLLGTIRYELPGQRPQAAPNTTPMAWDLQDWLARMAAGRCGAAVMEVSSHALSEERITGCEFDVGVFTNLSPEHLDYHVSLEEYAAAKARLFAQLAAPGLKAGVKYAVINRDDPRSRVMTLAARAAKIVTYGLDGSADVTATGLKLSPRHSTFRLRTPAGETPVRVLLPGRTNVLNALAAAAAAGCLGVPLRAIRTGLARLAGVPGRMEIVPGSQPFTVMVDYAHKPDALEKLLQAVREATPARVILVFGCGGDRDAGKRGPMGEISARLADRVVVTTDNPRSEDPGRIAAEILAGIRRSHPESLSDPGGRIRVEPDRVRAIRLGLRSARRGDTVVIAGKGHENYQIFKDRTVRFSDRAVALRELARLGFGRTAARRGRS